MLLFKATLQSFHKLCYHATDAMALLRRTPTRGLFRAAEDLTQQLMQHAEQVDVQLGNTWLEDDGILDRVTESGRESRDTRPSGVEEQSMITPDATPRAMSSASGSDSSRRAPSVASSRASGGSATTNTLGRVAAAGKKAKDVLTRKPRGLTGLVSDVEEVSLDLAYGIRAWCTLEQCYLPEAPHKDPRLLQAQRSLKKLRLAAERARRFRAVVNTEIPTLSEEGLEPRAIGADDAEGVIEPLAKLLNTLDHIDGHIAQCELSADNRRQYLNVWSYAHWGSNPGPALPESLLTSSPFEPCVGRYHYMKTCVLHITNMADYDYLDHLFVRSTALDPCSGVLYFLAIGGLGTHYLHRSRKRMLRMRSSRKKVAKPVTPGRTASRSPSRSPSRRSPPKKAERSHDGSSSAEEKLNKFPVSAAADPDAVPPKAAARAPPRPSKASSAEAADGHAVNASPSPSRREKDFERKKQAMLRKSGSKTNGPTSPSSFSERESAFGFYWPPHIPTPVELRLTEMVVGTPAGARPIGEQPNEQMLAALPSLKAGQKCIGLGGALLVEVVSYKAKKNHNGGKTELRVSSQGVLGAPPSVSELEVQWGGSSKDVRSFMVTVLSEREPTLDERKQHASVLKHMTLEQNLINSGIAALDPCSVSVNVRKSR